MILINCRRLLLLVGKFSIVNGVVTPVTLTAKNGMLTGDPATDAAVVYDKTSTKTAIETLVSRYNGTVDDTYAEKVGTFLITVPAPSPYEFAGSKTEHEITVKISLSGNDEWSVPASSATELAKITEASWTNIVLPAGTAICEAAVKEAIIAKAQTMVASAEWVVSGTRDVAAFVAGTWKGTFTVTKVSDVATSADVEVTYTIADELITTPGSAKSPVVGNASNQIVLPVAGAAIVADVSAGMEAIAGATLEDVSGGSTWTGGETQWDVGEKPVLKFVFTAAAGKTFKTDTAEWATTNFGIDGMTGYTVGVTVTGDRNEILTITYTKTDGLVATAINGADLTPNQTTGATVVLPANGVAPQVFTKPSPDNGIANATWESAVWSGNAAANWATADNNPTLTVIYNCTTNFDFTSGTPFVDVNVSDTNIGTLIGYTGAVSVAAQKLTITYTKATVGS